MLDDLKDTGLSGAELGFEARVVRLFKASDQHCFLLVSVATRLALGWGGVFSEG